jgi:hypothetical protein
LIQPHKNNCWKRGTIINDFFSRFEALFFMIYLCIL